MEEKVGPSCRWEVVKYVAHRAREHTLDFDDLGDLGVISRVLCILY